MSEIVHLKNDCLIHYNLSTNSTIQTNFYKKINVPIDFIIMKKGCSAILRNLKNLLFFRLTITFHI
jgi:hypothetical protein